MRAEQGSDKGREHRVTRSHKKGVRQEEWTEDRKQVIKGKEKEQWKNRTSIDRSRKLRGGGKGTKNEGEGTGGKEEERDERQ